MKCICGYTGSLFKPIFFDTPDSQKSDECKIKIGELKSFYVDAGYRTYRVMYVCQKCGTIKMDI